MLFISFVFKFYIVILLFRLVATAQEIRFNPVGKTVGMLTAPVFKALKIKDAHVAKVIPLLIIFLLILSGLLRMLFYKMNFISAIMTQTVDYLGFFMLFFIVCIILGSFVNKVSMSAYITYFFRLGVPWIKFTRMFVPISSGNIIYPAMVCVFVVYYLVVAGGYAFGSLLYAQMDVSLMNGDLRYYLISPLKEGLRCVSSLLSYAGWAVIIRAFMSWVSPDVRNPFVQLIYVLTEPILSFFRRFIPAIGMIDLSAIAAIIALNVASMVLQRLIVYI